MTSKATKVPILSTAGAIPIKNDKGEVTMEKVKVTRYVTGKRPDYAPDSSSDEDDEYGFHSRKSTQLRPEDEDVKEVEEDEDQDIRDRRLQRLRQRDRIADDSDEEEDRVTRHRRQVIEPEILAEVSDDEAKGGRDEKGSDDDDEEEEELDEEEIERRRAFRRQRAMQRRDEEEVMDVEEEKSDGESEEESSEYEECTDSEEETGPRLKPVFVRKKERVTIQEREKEELKQKDMEVEVKKMAEERRRQTLKIAEQELQREMEEERQEEDMLGDINTDDDEEAGYESFKIRETKRIKRSREEREAHEKEKMELDRVRNMTEEERRQEFKLNPKTVTNKAPKGKYKFLQKYYHRGAFFVSQDEDNTYKQDFSQPTLDDHFDKTILPKVMQVKNFGRSGRTKYTHLLDQDTTHFDSPWIADSMQNLKFHTSKGGGTKQLFERPSARNAQK